MGRVFKDKFEDETKKKYMCKNCESEISIVNDGYQNVESSSGDCIIVTETLNSQRERQERPAALLHYSSCVIYDDDCMYEEGVSSPLICRVCKYSLGWHYEDKGCIRYVLKKTSLNIKK